jgi:hypothetical protein
MNGQKLREQTVGLAFAPVEARRRIVNKMVAGRG